MSLKRNKPANTTKPSVKKKKKGKTPTADPKKTKKQLEKTLAEVQKKYEKYKTQLAYLQAEHDNYVKSMERRETQFRLQANRDLILKLLPVLDDLERAQIMIPQIETNEPFINGLNMVVDNLKTALKSAGVKQIECKGQLYDPLRHEAVVREETSEVPPNTVIEELRKGYLLKGALLRPTMVKIAIDSSSSKVDKQKSEKE